MLGIVEYKLWDIWGGLENMNTAAFLTDIRRNLSMTAHNILNDSI
jgi:hypothetical protein